MKCPKCGKEMTPGEIANAKGDFSFYWAPKTFFDKHWANTYCHTQKTIEEAGGVILKSNSKLQKVPGAYGCIECKLILADYG